MCTIEIIDNVSTSKCGWITRPDGNGEPHTYTKHIVKACKKATRRAEKTGIEKPCHNADRQGPHSGSILRIDCPVCIAGAIQDEKKARAKAKWEATVAAAHLEWEQAQVHWEQECSLPKVVMDFVSSKKWSAALKRW